MALFGKSLFARKSTDDEVVDDAGAAEEPYVPSEPLKRVLRARYLPGIEELNRQKEVAELAIGCFAKATQAMQSIRPLIKEARAIAIAAQRVESSEKREALSERYSRVRSKIDRLAQAASHKSVNLVDGSGDRLSLDVSAHYKANINISTINLTTDRKGLALPPVRFQFQEDVELNDILTCTEQAETYLDWASDLLCKEAQMIASRLAEAMTLAKSIS